MQGGGVVGGFACKMLGTSTFSNCLEDDFLKQTNTKTFVFSRPRLQNHPVTQAVFLPWHLLNSSFPTLNCFYFPSTTRKGLTSPLPYPSMPRHTKRAKVSHSSLPPCHLVNNPNLELKVLPPNPVSTTYATHHATKTATELCLPDNWPYPP